MKKAYTKAAAEKREALAAVTAIIAKPVSGITAD